MPEQTPLSHDDYCRIFGRVLFDAFYRIESLEQQIVPLHKSFQSQTEKLHQEVADLKEKLRHAHGSV